MFSYIKHLTYINNAADYKTCAKYIKGGYKVPIKASYEHSTFQRKFHKNIILLYYYLCSYILVRKLF